MSHLELLGWIANAILILGTWQVGNKDRRGFLLVALGEAIWIFASAKRESWSMTFICVVFAAMALRNFYSWGRDDA